MSSRQEQVQEIRDAILRYLWSENNTGFTVNQIADETGYEVGRIRYQLKQLLTLGHTQRVAQGRRHGHTRELSWVRTDDPLAKRRFSLFSEEARVYTQLPDIWTLTDAGHALINNRMCRMD